MKRIKLTLTSNLEVEFADRDLALKKVEEWAEKGMVKVEVVFGPEGCGKTAWLRQSAVLLRELGFHVIYVDPLNRYFEAYTDVKEVARRLADAAAETLGIAEVKLASLVIDLANELIKKKRKKVAVLADDVFQAIGLGEAAKYVKALLGIIEYPPASYERVIAVVATSEGITRREIGRHRWADLTPMWNMPRDGFKQLYDQIPGDKPSFEEVWRATGGNPKLLGELYEARWDVESVVERLVEKKELAPSFTARWRGWLEKAVEDPDALWSPDAPRELIDELVAKNLIAYFLSRRDPRFWAGEVPPERDSELGIGRRVAWQTPLHREAVRRALEEA
ncbi:MAG: ATP-binding protein [Pyrobaculum sp.]